jgi:6-phosphofructokinase 1
VSYPIADAVEKATGIETRVTILGHLQRGGTPTAFDRWLATRFGVKATQILKAGEFGKMVSLRGTRVESAPLKDAVRNLRLVDPDGEEVQTARATGVSFGA